MLGDNSKMQRISKILQFPVVPEIAGVRKTSRDPIELTGANAFPQPPVQHPLKVVYSQHR